MQTLVTHVLDRRGAAHRADLLALEVVLAVDVVVVLGDQQALTGDEVRAGEADLLLALVVDRVGADVVVDVAVHDGLLTSGGRDGLVLDRLRVEPELRRDEACDLDVEALVLTRGRVLVTQVRLVLLDADDDVTGLLHAVEGRGVLDGDVLRHLVAQSRRAAAVAVPAFGVGRRPFLAACGEGEARGQQSHRQGANLHGTSPVSVEAARAATTCVSE